MALERKNVPTRTATKLWILSGGRCQYDGCNTPLWQDSLTQRAINKAYISHIIAASPDGPRGDKKKSPLLEIDFDNLMLLCDECHNRIDEADVDNHSVEKLIEMKRKHEERIKTVTGIDHANRSVVISYMAKVGEVYPTLTKKKAFETIIPDFYPSEGLFIEGGTKNSPIDDHEEEYWINETLGLERWYSQKVRPMIDGGMVQHLSVFAIAPQPLLIKLGSLISELQPANVFQYFRDPQDSWSWQNDVEDIKVKLIPPFHFLGLPVLKLELSSPVNNNRIENVFGNIDLSIWTITVENPRRDLVKSKAQLETLKQIFREGFDKIKLNHPDHKEIHVFPIMPNSAAVEFGRVRMPKADKELVIYDQNNKKDAFIKTLTIH